jgi:adenylosuccinate synthase
MNVLLEGAQGALIGVECGTYPFVTSSDPTKAGLAKGVGLLSEQIDFTLGVVKGYITRVGGGPLPTKIGGTRADKWYDGEAARITAAEGYASVEEMEVAKFGSIAWDDPDEFKLALAIGVAGREFGATTGRPRQIGLLDLPLLRHAMQFNGPNVIFTKFDVLKCPTIRICTAYRYDGPDYRLDGQHNLTKGDMISIAIPAAEVLEHCRPVYQDFPGWCSSIGHIKSAGKLPIQLKSVMKFIEEQAGVKWQILSVGPDRNQTIFRE